MSRQNGEQSFLEAAEQTGANLRKRLAYVPSAVKYTASEIRLRVGRPLCIQAGGKTWFVDDSARATTERTGQAYLVTRQDLEETFKILCGFSVHSHQHEIRNGYISMRGGHRAGICGTAVLEGERVSGVRDISSINIRVARQVPGAADRLIDNLRQNGLAGMLVAGAPGAGKTTVLRDLTRQLADGALGRTVKVSVVDERGELGAVYAGVPQNDLGVCADVLDGYPKAQGIESAVRALSPDVVVCDEIGAAADVAALEQGLNSGVVVIASVHAASVEELAGKAGILHLMRLGAFERVVLLDGAAGPGRVAGIYKAGDVVDQADGNGAAAGGLQYDGHVSGTGADTARPAARAGNFDGRVYCG